MFYSQLFTSAIFTFTFYMDPLSTIECECFCVRRNKFSEIEVL